MQTWVVKLSKFCNMRCSYCYEWNELGNPNRMSLELWRSVLRAAIEYNSRNIVAGRTSESTQVLVILHGGEPFALPTQYLRDILAAFDDVTRAARGVYRLALQTNLYSVSDEKVALMRQHNVLMSFSYDVVPGVRLNIQGRPTEATVARNIERLRSMGIYMNGIAVLAKHTVDRVTDVYDFYAQHGMGMRILPLFDGPTDRPADNFMVDHSAMVAALERLFRHWMVTGQKVFIAPFDLYFQAALRHMGGLRVSQFRRRDRSDGVLLVNLDGNVYRVVDAYDQHLALGNLANQSLEQILHSDAYEASLARDAEEFRKQCADCEFRTACNGSFLYDTRARFPYTGACVTAWHCIEFMVRFIREQGYSERDVQQLALQLRDPSRRPQPTVNL